MSKRKLVEISNEHHERLTTIRQGYVTRGEPVPTIPALVKAALSLGLPKLEAKYPKAPKNRVEDPVVINSESVERVP
jgi:hypothetical protein